MKKAIKAVVYLYFFYAAVPLLLRNPNSSDFFVVSTDCFSYSEHTQNTSKAETTQKIQISVIGKPCCFIWWQFQLGIGV